MFCGQLPKLHGNVKGVVPINNMRVLHYVIVMTQATTGSRVVRELLHTGHYVVYFFGSKLTFGQYPAIHTNYSLSNCTSLQYNHNI